MAQEVTCLLCCTYFSMNGIPRSFRGEQLNDKATLETYSRDYSLFRVLPTTVVCPKNAREVCQLVEWVSERRRLGEDVSLTARAAGTDMTGGPLTHSVVVSFTQHFHHVKRVTAQYALVEPGVYFRDLEKQLSRRGLLYPAYPASKDMCAIGGMIANNSGGEKSLAYGKTEEYVQELKLVLSDAAVHTIAPLSGMMLHSKLREQTFEGDLYRRVMQLIEDHAQAIKRARPRVSKNSSGYALWNVWDGKTFDLTKLFVGSQGTLGLVVEAKLGLVKPKTFSRLAVIFLQDLTCLGDLIVELLQFHPESLESYDDKTLDVAIRLRRELLQTLKGSLLKLAWELLPEFGMVLRAHAMPKMVILVELTDDDEQLLGQRLKDLKNSVQVFSFSHRGVQIHVLRDEAEAEKYWTIRRQSFALLHGQIKEKDTAPFIDDVVVDPSVLPEFLPRLNAILDIYKKDLIYTVAGHPGNGNFHIIPLMDLKDPRVRRLIPVISRQVYALVHHYHGSITGEHNDGLIRTPYLKEQFGAEMVEVFAEIKKIFDPLNIFNPGKKVGGSLRESLKLISSARK